jgi:hypothetical protein
MYLDKVKLHAALTDYLTKCEECAEQGIERPRVTEYIGECIYLLNHNLAKRPNFSGYSFKEDMIDNGIELCLRYIRNYNFRKYNNPHAFFTYYAWRGFVDVISSEEDQAYIRAKLSVSPEELNSALQEVDKDYHPDSEDLSAPYFDIHDYEKRKFKKTVSAKEEFKLVGLEHFIEELDNGIITEEK